MPENNAQPRQLVKNDLTVPGCLKISIVLAYLSAWTVVATASRTAKTAAITIRYIVNAPLYLPIDFCLDISKTGYDVRPQAAFGPEKTNPVNMVRKSRHFAYVFNF